MSEEFTQNEVGRNPFLIINQLKTQFIDVEISYTDDLTSYNFRIEGDKNNIRIEDLADNSFRFVANCYSPSKFNQQLLNELYGQYSEIQLIPNLEDILVVTMSVKTKNESGQQSIMRGTNMIKGCYEYFQKRHPQKQIWFVSKWYSPEKCPGMSTNYDIYYSNIELKLSKSESALSTPTGKAMRMIEMSTPIIQEFDDLVLGYFFKPDTNNIYNP